ncbi:MAG TPA: DUF4118 domain-containing protein [Thermoanaerobaculia bacterium]|nr:DUF4118 domain-containing protein [Thermoanaerobaculia bacterium]
MPATVALVTWFGRSLGANATTMGFLYLLAVLGLATWGGWAVGATAAAAATLCFNYFFFHPFGTLTIAEPANWVALFSFLAAATLASRLVATARAREEEAQRRRQEVEILYDLCFGLFAASQRPGALGEAAARTLRAIGAESGTLLLGTEDRREVASVIGEPPVPHEALLAQAWMARRVVKLDGEGGTVYIPLEVGGKATGVLAAEGPRASRAILESAGRLLGLAVERERLLAEAAYLQAMQESEALRTSLLRAVSHDLRTPLTAMRLEIESLGRHLQTPHAMDSLRVLSLEQERLARRIDNLLALARLEAGLAHPRPEAVPPSSIFRAARESLRLILEGRPVEVRVAPRCPDLWADPSLTLEIVVNLLENAARATPPGRPLELAASPDPEAPTRVHVEILDRGPGVPQAVQRLLAGPRELRRTGDHAAGDSAAGGLGLRIAKSFAEANGGSLALLDRPGGGTVARVTLPAAGEVGA